MTPDAVGEPEPGICRRSWGAVLAVSFLTLLGAVVRLSTLGRQSFWLDELYTHWLSGLDLDSMLEEIRRTERTPYLYYVLEWLSVRLVGDGEAGARLLSAIAGVATIPAAYLAAAALGSQRVGVAAAALVAVNPFLIWYSQEARAYALAILLVTLALWLWARSLGGASWALVGWTVAAALAVASHYIALFVLVPQALWLLARARPRGRVVVACAALVGVVAAHASLARSQAEGGRTYDDSSLSRRVAGVAKDMVVGYSFPLEAVGTGLAALLVAFGAFLALRATVPDRRAVTHAGGIGLAALAIPVSLAFGGHDYVVAPHLILALVPLLVALAAGFASSRVGWAGLSLYAALSIAIVVSAAADLQYGRTDWRGAARGAASVAPPRVLVVTPVIRADLLQPYFPHLKSIESPVETARIVVLGLATEGVGAIGHPSPPPPRVAAPPAGFRQEGVVSRPTYSLVRYVADRPRAVTLEELQTLRLAGEYARVFAQR